MTTVAIETSTRAASVALLHDGETRSATLSGARAHASDLLPELDRMLAELGAEASTIDTVFVGTGPGSYTGLRVGIATALGIARGAAAALLGVPSGEIVAYAELAPGDEGVVLLDARQAQLYFARYRRTQDDVEVLHAPSILTPDELEPYLAGDARIFGDETVATAARLGPAERARLTVDVRPTAADLLALGKRQLERRGPDAPRDVEPLYLRPFAAKARKRQGR